MPVCSLWFEDFKTEIRRPQPSSGSRRLIPLEKPKSTWASHVTAADKQDESSFLKRKGSALDLLFGNTFLKSWRKCHFSVLASISYINFNLIFFSQLVTNKIKAFHHLKIKFQIFCPLVKMKFRIKNILLFPEKISSWIFLFKISSLRNSSSRIPKSLNLKWPAKCRQYKWEKGTIVKRILWILGPERKAITKLTPQSRQYPKVKISRVSLSVIMPSAFRQHTHFPIFLHQSSFYSNLWMYSRQNSEEKNYE